MALTRMVSILLVSVLTSGAAVSEGDPIVEQYRAEDIDGLLKQALNSSGSSKLSQQLSQAEAVLGFSIQNDLLPLFAGEGGIAVYPAAAPGGKSTFVFGPGCANRFLAFNASLRKNSKRLPWN